MKVKVTWYDSLIDKYFELVGTREFKGSFEEVFGKYGEALQEVVDWYEGLYTTVDQGGDEDWLEFDLADYYPPEDDPNLPKILLDKLENIEEDTLT